MKEKIKKTIAETLKINPSILTEDLGPGDIPEWDSLAHQNLILALEKDFVSAMSKSVIETGKPKSTRLVTPCSVMPQGTIP